MGCDIHLSYQRCVAGRWYDVPVPNGDYGLPLNYHSYGLFGFLADVRNYSRVPPIAEPRGLPIDFTVREDTYVGDHSFSWLSINELLAYDYDQPFEDRRVMRDNNGGALAGPGEGKMTTLRDFLGDSYFDDLQTMVGAGVERIVFGFDS